DAGGLFERRAPFFLAHRNLDLDERPKIFLRHSKAFGALPEPKPPLAWTQTGQPLGFDVLAPDGFFRIRGGKFGNVARCVVGHEHTTLANACTGAAPDQPCREEEARGRDRRAAEMHEWWPRQGSRGQYLCSSECQHEVVKRRFMSLNGHSKSGCEMNPERDLDPDTLSAHAFVVETPHRSEQGWLSAFGVAAIFVVWSPASTRCPVGATQDLAKALAAQRRSIGRDAQLARVWWVSSLEAALELARAAGPVPGSNTTIEAIERRIREAARQRRIPLAEHAPTLERARTALARLDRGLALAKQRGVLQQFNWRFKFLRQKQPRLDYGRAYAALKAERRLAASAGALPDLAGIVDAVLPIK